MLEAEVELVPHGDELDADDVENGASGDALGGTALAQEEVLGHVAQHDQGGEDDDGHGEEPLALGGLGAAPLGAPVADEGGEVAVGGVVAVVAVLVGRSRLGWGSLGVWSRGDSHLAGSLVIRWQKAGRLVSLWTPSSKSGLLFQCGGWEQAVWNPLRVVV